MRSTKIRLIFLLLLIMPLVSIFAMDSMHRISANPPAAAFNEKVEVNKPFGLCHAGYSASDKEYDLLNDLGNNWLRVDFSWASIEREVGV